MNAPALDDADLRVAAAELGVSPPFLAQVLERRGLHLKPTPKTRKPRQYVPKRDVIRFASATLKRHAKVLTDQDFKAGVIELADFLETEV